MESDNHVYACPIWQLGLKCYSRIEKVCICMVKESKSSHGWSETKEWPLNIKLAVGAFIGALTLSVFGGTAVGVYELAQRPITLDNIYVRSTACDGGQDMTRPMLPAQAEQFASTHGGPKTVCYVGKSSVTATQWFPVEERN